MVLPIDWFLIFSLPYHNQMLMEISPTLFLLILYSARIRLLEFFGWCIPITTLIFCAFVGSNSRLWSLTCRVRSHGLTIYTRRSSQPILDLIQTKAQWCEFSVKIFFVFPLVLSKKRRSVTILTLSCTLPPHLNAVILCFFLPRQLKP